MFLESSFYMVIQFSAIALKSIIKLKLKIKLPSPRSFFFSFSFRSLLYVILELLRLKKPAFWRLFTQMTANFVTLVLKKSVTYV